MATRKQKPQPEQSGPLRTALELARRTRALAAIASEAQVATNTLALVRKGKPIAFGPDDERKKAGLAESLTRLAIYLKVDVREALAEFGLSDEEQSVLNGIERARRTAQRPQMVPDKALEAMELRRIQANAEECVVELGVLSWAPFHGEKPEDNMPFALEYMERLIHAINPYWSVHHTTVTGIDRAIRGLVADDPEFDLVFGLYSTPYRQQSGLDFIPVPGLSIELGAITRLPLSWRDIIDPRGETLLALVLDKEAGFHLLRGAAGYKPGYVRAISDRHPPRLAAELLRLDRSEGKDVVFVADAFTCNDVRDALRNGNWLRYWQSDQAPPEVSEIAEFELVDADNADGWAPRFDVAVAVRADSPRLRNLLIDAQRNDLFDRGRLAISRLYQDLYQRAGASGRLLDPSSFVTSLGDRGSNRFALAWKRVIDDIVTRNPRTKLKLPEEIEDLVKAESRRL